MMSVSNIDISQKRINKNKIVEEYRKISSSFDEAHDKVSENKSKVQDMERKLSCLQFLAKQSEKQSFKYQRKLQKLQSTQTYAAALLELKYKNFIQKERYSESKQQKCMSQRNSLEQSKKAAIQFYRKQHNRMIQLAKQEIEKSQNQSKKNRYRLQNLKRTQKEEIRSQQLRLRDRKKRIQMYKLQQASLNYQQKVHQQFENFQKNQKILQELKRQCKVEQKIFRTTQYLKRHTSKIESMYLTGTQG